MGKDGGYLTPKAISNRIKAKGLLKLKFFCQMCQKQCRDANGFKCHLMSESHQRQMAVFAETPDAFMDEFSKAFEKGFMRILSRRGGCRVFANHVYQEYISNRMHVHMNATMWDTLSTFVQYLGRTGKAEVDRTARGWFIKYVERDPLKLARQKASETNEKLQVDIEERNERLIKQQMKEAQKHEEEKASRKTDNESTAEQELEAEEDVKRKEVTFAMKKPVIASQKPDAASHVFQKPAPKMPTNKAAGFSLSNPLLSSKKSLLSSKKSVFSSSSNKPDTIISKPSSNSSNRGKKRSVTLSAMEQLIIENEEKKRRIGARKI